MIIIDYILNKAERGIALVAALIVTAVVLLLIMSTLYVITSSTSISGAGKRYATACEAADGGIEITKDGILKEWDQDVLPAGLPTGNCPGKSYDFSYAVRQHKDSPCDFSLSLPGVTGEKYSVNISLEYLFTFHKKGDSIRHVEQNVGGGSGTMPYYRIKSVVSGPDNTVCENSVLYREVV